MLLSLKAFSYNRSVDFVLGTAFKVIVCVCVGFEAPEVRRQGDGKSSMSVR